MITLPCKETNLDDLIESLEKTQSHNCERYSRDFGINVDYNDFADIIQIFKDLNDFGGNSVFSQEMQVTTRDYEDNPNNISRHLAEDLLRGLVDNVSVRVTNAPDNTVTGTTNLVAKLMIYKPKRSKQ